MEDHPSHLRPTRSVRSRPDTHAVDPLSLRSVEAVADRSTITVEEAASLLGIGRSAAYEAARRGQLPTRRLGRRLFVPVPALLEWLGAASRSEQGKTLHL